MATVRKPSNEAMRAWRNGMTRSQMLQFFEYHKWKCDICDEPWDDAKKGGGLCIDHDHSCCASQAPGVPIKERSKQLCGRCTRGLLCIACNAALGQFQDSPDALRKAVEYLAAPIRSLPAHPPLPSDKPRSNAARLTVEIVTSARRAHLVDGISCTELSIMYGVHKSTMSLALLGRTWAHVPMPV